MGDEPRVYLWDIEGVPVLSDHNVSFGKKSVNIQTKLLIVRRVFGVIGEDSDLFTLELIRTGKKVPRLYYFDGILLINAPCKNHKGARLYIAKQ